MGTIFTHLVYGVLVDGDSLIDVAEYYDENRGAIRTWSKITELRVAGRLRCGSVASAGLSDLPVEIMINIDRHLW